MSGKKLIVIGGPTGVGKTSVAIQLARHYSTAIISADSRQIFRELNIGTAKPSEGELAQAPHYFINTHSIQEDYDAARYGDDALRKINELFINHNTVFLCGGSGLYVKAVLEGFDAIPEIPGKIRKEIMNQYHQHGIAWLQNQMLALDPEHYRQLDPQNPHRLSRALEVRTFTGKSISAFRKMKKRQHDFSIVKIGLELPREELFSRIDRRMEEMIAGGLIHEAESLYDLRHHHALHTVGYKEVFDFIDHQYDRDECTRLLKRNTRRYAKRQLTWFKKDKEYRWFHPDEVHKMIAHIDHGP